MATKDTGIQRMVYGVAGTLLAGLVLFTANTARHHETTMIEHEARLNVLEAKPIPPPWVRDRIARNEEELKRQQQQIDRLENALNAKGKPLPPYSGNDAEMDDLSAYTAIHFVECAGELAGGCPPSDCRTNTDCVPGCVCVEGVCE